YDYSPSGSFTPPIVPSENGSWDWSGTAREIPGVLRDLITAVSTADYQRKLMEINLERARRGQPPLDPARYGPGITVRAAPGTFKQAATSFAPVVLGAVAIGALAYILARR
ncbi:MAG: hypothetical protein NZM12_07975, partial [Steroidobacteraceae bacterium]|nr:hypothetical protein [Steroidobacteraceae bacterium]